MMICKASAQCIKSIYYSMPISNVEVEATESSKALNKTKGIIQWYIADVLLLSASWQGIVNAPIDRAS